MKSEAKIRAEPRLNLNEPIPVISEKELSSSDYSIVKKTKKLLKSKKQINVSILCWEGKNTEKNTLKIFDILCQLAMRQ